MEGMRVKLISATDPDMFQERLQRFLEAMPQEAILVDIKFSTSSQGNSLAFSALVQYKSVEEWKD
jgi:hypothetical protein